MGFIDDSERAQAYDSLTLKDSYLISTGLSQNSNDDLYHSYGIYTPSSIDYINKRYRNGLINPYQSLTTVREYLFFTKPNLNIIQQDSAAQTRSANPGPTKLLPVLQDFPFWNVLVDKYPGVVGCLQQSAKYPDGHGRLSSSNNFNNLLANMVQSNLEVPSVSAATIETPVNLYGVGYSYRSSSEASDDNPSFTLEFKDTRYLPVYHFFKAYDEYETLKHHGRIVPSLYYIANKTIHDAYSVYKFLVDEDQETIVYYGKYYGVTSKTVPRDVFSQTSFDNGISYTVEFQAAFYDDMKPEILIEFNKLAYDYWKSLSYDIAPYSIHTGLADNRPAKSAIVVREEHHMSANNKSYIIGIAAGGDSNEAVGYINPNPTPHSKDPGNWVYKLKWRGDDAS